jgi:hypothetical protein
MLNVNSGLTGNCLSTCRKMPGLLLWHVDVGRIEAGRGTNTVNTGPIQGVALEQADGRNSLRATGSGRNRGDAGDPYPGSTGNTRWSLTTLPSARSNVGDYAGFIVDQIEQLPGGAMRFRYLKREPSLVRSALPGAAVRVNGTAYTPAFADAVPQGDVFTISADDVQEFSSGRSKARWLGWSIGGPRTQSVTSGLKPDTITATFAAEHRVVVLVSGTGAGTVTATNGANAAAGFFVPAGTPVTLTAAPLAGATFVGWRGDTTSATAAITLPMGRPYDLEASFLTTLQISVDDATTEILGSPVLSQEQRVFLDQLGNRNGLFDLGDYLALLRRNGQPVPAGLLARLAKSAKTGGG